MMQSPQLLIGNCLLLMYKLQAKLLMKTWVYK